MANQPFQTSLNNSPGQPGTTFIFSINVPAGKTLAITSASVQISVPPGQHVRAVLSANGPPGVTVGTQYFVLTPQGTFAGVDIFTANHSMLLWAGSGGASFTLVRSSTTGLMKAEVAAVGYFEG